MATKKKVSKSFLNRVHALTQKDVSHSFIIASLLFNVLFFAGVFVVTSTDTFDAGMLNLVNRRFCQNTKSLNERIEQLGEEKAIEDWHIACISKEFKPYYKEAVSKFRASTTPSKTDKSDTY